MLPSGGVCIHARNWNHIGMFQLRALCASDPSLDRWRQSVLANQCRKVYALIKVHSGDHCRGYFSESKGGRDVVVCASHGYSSECKGDKHSRAWLQHEAAPPVIGQVGSGRRYRETFCLLLPQISLSSWPVVPSRWPLRVLVPNPLVICHSFTATGVAPEQAPFEH